MMHATTVRNDKMKMVTRAIIHGSIETFFVLQKKIINGTQRSFFCNQQSSRLADEFRPPLPEPPPKKKKIHAPKI
ncbi:Uncharacterized protein APZ42_003347 [Daphnia magna]|uniref:Uncharacterized protein n=1 Tax=Daphnia magna TaxID=35525 RepID=A0A162CX19_9CRUS|nr:Uncharacterized protein APZ42_003347 [Daphnia magna]